MSDPRGVLHEIEWDIHEQRSGYPRWFVFAALHARCEFELLKTKHARADEVFNRLYPE